MPRGSEALNGKASGAECPKAVRQQEKDFHCPMPQLRTVCGCNEGDPLRNTPEKTNNTLMERRCPLLPIVVVVCRGTLTTPCPRQLGRALKETHRLGSGFGGWGVWRGGFGGLGRSRGSPRGGGGVGQVVRRGHSAARGEGDFGREGESLGDHRPGGG